MNRFRRFLSGSVVVVLLGFTLTAGASTVPSLAVSSDMTGDMLGREAAGLEGHRVMVTAEQLTAAGGTTERGAWTSQKGAMSAKDASRYSIRSTVGLEKGLGSVDPIRPYPAGQLLGPSWKNRIPMPRYTGLGLANPTSLLLIPAVAGWEYRGSMTDGLLSFAGMSTSSDLVCGDDGFGSGGFRNWLTGADCTAWAANAEFDANAGVVPGVTGGEVCSTTYDQNYCLTLVGQTSPAGYPDIPVYAFSYRQIAPFTTNVAGLSWKSKDNYIYGTSSTKCDSRSLNKYSKACGLAFGDDKWGFGFGIAPPRSRQMATYSIDDPAKAQQLSVTDMDPLHTRVCEQTGSDGNVYSSTSDPYRESAVLTEGFPALACSRVPDGVTSDSLRILEKSPGKSDKILADQSADATPETDALLGGSASKYCQEKVCVLDLSIKSSGLTCFSQGETCLGWWNEEAHGDAKYQCSYAGINVKIADCALYSTIFDTQKRLAGNPYSDPVTGDEVRSQTGPSIDKNMMGTIPRAGFQGRDCFGAGYGSANPVQWVLRPLQCFGEWAFVPRPSVALTELETVRVNWESTTPGRFANTVSGFKFNPPAGGCSGITVDVFFLGPPFQILSACPGEPLAVMAYWSRIFGNLAFTVMGVVAVSRALAGTVSYRGLGAGA